MRLKSLQTVFVRTRYIWSPLLACSSILMRFLGGKSPTHHAASETWDPWIHVSRLRGKQWSPLFPNHEQSSDAARTLLDYPETASNWWYQFLSVSYLVSTVSSRNVTPMLPTIRLSLGHIPTGNANRWCWIFPNPASQTHLASLGPGSGSRPYERRASFNSDVHRSTAQPGLNLPSRV